MFGRQSAQRFNHAFFYIRFYQHFSQKHHHPYAVGEESEYLEREFCAMQKVVDRYYHAEIDGDHLRKPRDLVFRGRARQIEQVEFRHKKQSVLNRWGGAWQGGLFGAGRWEANADPPSRRDGVTGTLRS